MKHLLACLAIFASLSASAQVVYPYNPDANGDGAITSGDLLDFLPMFATTYTPLGITIDGVPLDEWLSNLESVVNSNAASIESLFAMQSQINELEATNNNLQDQINSLQDQLNDLSLIVGALPPCEDIDGDGICDFADVCAHFSIDFVWGIYSYSNFSPHPWDPPESSNCLAPEGYYPIAQLANTDLSGVDLSGTYLVWSTLEYSNLSGANLINTALDSSLANYANFTDANLTGAGLASCMLNNTNFSNADLSNANLGGAFLNYANLEGANLIGANLIGATLTGATLTGATLTGAHMTCLVGCPSLLPTGYTCELHTDCGYGGLHYRIVPD